MMHYQPSTAIVAVVTAFPVAALSAPASITAASLAAAAKARRMKWAKSARGIVDPDETRACHDFRPPAEECDAGSRMHTMEAKSARKIRDAAMLELWLDGHNLLSISRMHDISPRGVAKVRDRDSWPEREAPEPIAQITPEQYCAKYEARMYAKGWQGRVRYCGSGWAHIEPTIGPGCKLRMTDLKARMGL